MKLVFKEAPTADEIPQIHALNHATFALEIPQHLTQPSGLLIDHFIRETATLSPWATATSSGGSP